MLFSILLPCRSSYNTQTLKSKRLHQLLWSLMAQLSSSKDTRLLHLRVLWLKQVKALDSEGGVVLCAFNVRVTYVNIIQVSESNMVMYWIFANFVPMANNNKLSVFFLSFNQHTNHMQQLVQLLLYISTILMITI